MHIPEYWARAAADERGRRCGLDEGFIALGWSDQSPRHAEEQAFANARRIAERFARGADLDDTYPYPDRPVREPIVERRAEDGWAITRNAYGALVLNTEDVMFIDIDRPAPTGLIGRLFGRRKAAADDPIPDRVREVVAAMDGMHVHLHETAGGYRAIVTSERYDPASDLAADVLGAFGSDARYRALCRAQRSFRARLTPKPWRCGLAAPSGRYPFRDEKAAAAFDRWLGDYEHAARGFAVCGPAVPIGSGRVLPDLQPVLDLHERYTRADAPLA